MKNLLLICFALFSLTAFSQDTQTTAKTFPVKDGKVLYEGVVEVSGKTKDQLYKNAKKWFVDAFRSSKDVIQSDDKDGGQIIGKGWFYSTNTTEKYRIQTTIQVDCKDGRYRYRIYDIATTVDGKTESDPNAKYLVNVTAEFWNEKLTKENNGFSKKQKVLIQNDILGMDSSIQSAITSLGKAMNSAGDDF